MEWEKGQLIDAKTQVAEMLELFNKDPKTPIIKLHQQAITKCLKQVKKITTPEQGNRSCKE